MSEQALRKQILLERVQANREMLRLEVDAVRGKFDVVRSLAKVGSSFLPQVGAVAATAAGAVGANKARAGGAVGLAALAPIVIAVAKLVISWNKRRSPARAKRSAGANRAAEAEQPAEETS